MKIQLQKPILEMSLKVAFYYDSDNPKEKDNELSKEHLTDIASHITLLPVDDLVKGRIRNYIQSYQVFNLPKNYLTVEKCILVILRSIEEPNDDYMKYIFNIRRRIFENDKELVLDNDKHIRFLKTVIKGATKEVIEHFHKGQLLALFDDAAHADVAFMDDVIKTIDLSNFDNYMKPISQETQEMSVEDSKPLELNTPDNGEKKQAEVSI